MAFLKFSNNAEGTLYASTLIGATSFQLGVGEGSLFPALSSNDYCYLRIGTNDDNEVVRVTARSGDVFTCDPTTKAHTVGASVALTVCNELLQDLVQQNELAVYAMAIARMRGAGPSSNGVIVASGDLSIDDDLKVVAQSTPNMTVKVKAGAGIVLGQFTGIPQDVNIAIPAPTINNRYTIVQLSQTGAVTIKHGVEAGSPVAPAVDAGNYKIGTVLLGVASTAITNGDITDDRTNAI